MKTNVELNSPQEEGLYKSKQNEQAKDIINKNEDNSNINNINENKEKNKEDKNKIKNDRNENNNNVNHILIEKNKLNMKKQDKMQKIL